MYRYALVVGARSRREVEAYLPDGYEVIAEVGSDYAIRAFREIGPGDQPERVVFVIRGEDFAGWTLDAYVIPRLGSGLINATEIDLSHPVMKCVPLV
jgi:hypothetical protein